MRTFAFILLLVMTCPVRAHWIDTEWTVLAFLDGEGTLEEPTLTNLAQMMKVGSTPRVRLIVLVDRPGKASRENDGIPDWSGARLMEVERGKLTMLEDWGPTNTAQGGVLERFVKAGVAKFPARHYMLVIGDHGLGWAGVCVDEDGRDRLTLPELSAALTACRAELDGKLEIIGMDACLMATAEVAVELAEHAKVLVASEEAAPTDGWRYDRLLEELSIHPNMRPEDLGKLIVETYRGQFEAAAEDKQLRAALGVTLSVVNLAKVPAVVSALDWVAAETLALLDAEGGFDVLARARASCAAFGGGERTDSGSEMFDVCDLADQLRREPADRRLALRPALAQLDLATRAAVVHNMSGRARSDAKGLSVFWPDSAQRLADEEARYAELGITARSRWGAFLAKFGAMKDARTATVDLVDVALSGASASRAHPVTLSARLGAGAPEATWLGIWAPPASLGAPDLLLASRPMEVTTAGIEEKYDGRWLMVTEGGRGFPADVADFDDVDGAPDEVMMHLSAEHCREGETRWSDVQLHFYFVNEDEPHGELAYVSGRRPGAPEMLHLRRGDRLRPIHWTIDPDGKVKRHEAARGYEITLRQPRDVKLEMKALKPGRYGLGVVARDAADRWTYRMKPVAVR